VWCVRALQQQVDYLKGENQVLKDKLAHHNLDITDADRRRLAVLGHLLGRKLLAKVATIAPADTILRWYRDLASGAKTRSNGSSRLSVVEAEESAESLATDWRANGVFLLR